MRTIVLGPNAAELAPVLGEDLVAAHEGLCTVDVLERAGAEAIVSFGHRHIVSADVLEAVDWRALNLHISLLPWNRGADPNLWSWLENTPKGVSVHWMTSGLDRGELAGQQVIELDPLQTLRSTHARLQVAVVQVFAMVWPEVRVGGGERRAQTPGGTYHKSADKDPHLAVLTDGWDTTCAAVLEYGRRQGLWVS